MYEFKLNIKRLCKSNYNHHTHKMTLPTSNWTSILNTFKEANTDILEFQLHDKHDKSAYVNWELINEVKKY